MGCASSVPAEEGPAGGPTRPAPGRQQQQQQQQPPQPQPQQALPALLHQVLTSKAGKGLADAHGGPPGDAAAATAAAAAQGGDGVVTVWDARGERAASLNGRQGAADADAGGPWLSDAASGRGKNHLPGACSPQSPASTGGGPAAGAAGPFTNSAAGGGAQQPPGGVDSLFVATPSPGLFGRASFNRPSLRVFGLDRATPSQAGRRADATGASTNGTAAAASGGGGSKGASPDGGDEVLRLDSSPGDGAGIVSGMSGLLARLRPDAIARRLSIGGRTSSSYNGVRSSYNGGAASRKSLGGPVHHVAGGGGAAHQGPASELRASQLRAVGRPGMHGVPAELMVLDLSDDEDDVLVGGGPLGRFDMLLWKRHYQWNRNKPKDLLRHLWKRYDRTQWTFYVISYRQQDALETPYQGENIIHGLTCRIEELLTGALASGQGEGAPSGPPGGPNSLASSGSTSSGASSASVSAGDKLFGVVHTLGSRHDHGHKVVGVLLAQGAAHIPKCLAGLYELGCDWQVAAADVSDPTVRGFVGSLICGQPPTPEYTVLSTREVL